MIPNKGEVSRRLEGRVALVTGASRGIGAAIAIRLAADGARVVVHGSGSPERAAAVVDAIRAAGGAADVVIADLTTASASCEVVATTFDIYGALDILVNNAGVSISRPITEYTAENVEPQLALNLRAFLLSTAEFARRTQSRHGRVINISSIAGRHAVMERGVYSATKGAMEAFTRSAALELGRRGITVNAVAPGTTVTDAFEENERRDTKDWRALFAQWTALGRVGESSDIADIVSFVASDDARWLTGATIPADGGIVTTGTNIAAFIR